MRGNTNTNLEESSPSTEDYICEQGAVAELLGRGEECVVVIVPLQTEILAHSDAAAVDSVSSTTLHKAAPIV